MKGNLPSPPIPTDAILRVRGISKRYVRGGLLRNRTPVMAVEGVDLEIPAGRTLALVGESGSGKSTVARCVARLEKPDAGQIWIAGESISGRDFGNPDSSRPAAKRSPRANLLLRNQVQMVFQDAITSMNPRFSARRVIEEPLLIMGVGAQLRSDAARTAMNEVGLSADWLDRSVMEFSGGQRQRLAIARALVARPKLLVLDEALTGLDLSTQAQIANLLLDLQAAHSLTYLLISHDLALVARVADTIAVMARGRIVEKGPTFEIMTAPKHEDTIRLLAWSRAAQSNFANISEMPA
ncbi:MAG: dipeptide/oligopeptide/nickel ABC transporter ATP-binding protein [Terriglobales bacterium]